ncbi:MAG: AbrB/MazE/SpoVT family DNA-binding domain-containing protein [archaeon]
MEQRKLIRLGNSSFALALPKDWVDKAGLKKGDNIFLERNSNGEIIVSPRFRKVNGGKKLELDLSKKTDFEIKKEINYAYIKGYTDLNVLTGGDKKLASMIKGEVDNLLGMEVVENNKENMLIRDFLNFEDMNQESFIRRVDNNLREMFEILVSSANKNLVSQAQLNESIQADRDINKFYFLNLRILATGVDNPSLLASLKTDGISLLMKGFYSQHLEKIGDRIKAILQIIKDVKINKDSLDKISSLVPRVQKMYIDSMEAFYKKDRELAIKVGGEGHKIWKECDKFLKDKDTGVVKIAFNLKDLENAIYQNLKLIIYIMN